MTDFLGDSNRGIAFLTEILDGVDKMLKQVPEGHTALLAVRVLYYSAPFASDGMIAADEIHTELDRDFDDDISEYGISHAQMSDGITLGVFVDSIPTTLLQNGIELSTEGSDFVVHLRRLRQEVAVAMLTVTDNKVLTRIWLQPVFDTRPVFYSSEWVVLRDSDVDTIYTSDVMVGHDRLRFSVGAISGEDIYRLRHELANSVIPPEAMMAYISSLHPNFDFYSEKDQALIDEWAPAILTKLLS